MTRWLWRGVALFVIAVVIAATMVMKGAPGESALATPMDRFWWIGVPRLQGWAMILAVLCALACWARAAVVRVRRGRRDGDAISLARAAVYVIGAVAAFCVVTAAAGFMGVTWLEWSQTQRTRAAVAEQTRTHDRPLDRRRTEGNVIEGEAAAALAPITFDDSRKADVFRFVSMPSFGAWRAVSMSLPAGAASAQGKMIRIDQSGFGTPMRASNEKTFAVTRAAYIRLVSTIDRLTEGWPGDGSDQCFDGEPVAFEHVRPRRVISGWGNADCDKHYAILQDVVSAFLHQFRT